MEVGTGQWNPLATLYSMPRPEDASLEEHGNVLLEAKLMCQLGDSPLWQGAQLQGVWSVDSLLLQTPSELPCPTSCPLGSPAGWLTEGGVWSDCHGEVSTNDSAHWRFWPGSLSWGRPRRCLLESQPGFLLCTALPPPIPFVLWTPDWHLPRTTNCLGCAPRTPKWVKGFTRDRKALQRVLGGACGVYSINITDLNWSWMFKVSGHFPRQVIRSSESNLSPSEAGCGENSAGLSETSSPRLLLALNNKAELSINERWHGSVRGKSNVRGVTWS